MGKVIIASITWSSTNWKGWVDSDKNYSGHRYVLEGNPPHEARNFDLDKDVNTVDHLYGFIQFTNYPRIKEGDNKNLIIFYSRNNIVGFYGEAGFIRDENTRKEKDDYNVYGNRKFSFVLKNKIENAKESGFLEGKKRVGMIGFNYILRNETVFKIIEKAKELNPEQIEELDNLKKWFVDNINLDEGTFSPNQKKNELSRQKQKNIILYGPPGTGKTYNTKRKALEIILGEDQVKNDNIDDLYNEYSHNIEFVTFHQSFSYEQFVEGISVETTEDGIKYYIKDGIFKNIVKKCEELPNSNFVLIIDEINRGNISKIFGELITLIEEDKRLVEDNEIIVTLPYSNEKFGIPQNLYIIGTMNTADRSLVQLDTALRRRFAFEEMMPNYETEEIWENPSKVKDFNLMEFLKNLNLKITEKLDREHQIGHSYMMKVENIESLQYTWENKILPLLQEYFYADYSTLGEIIGNNSCYLKNGGDLTLKCPQETNFKDEFQKIYNKVTNIKDN